MKRTTIETTGFFQINKSWVDEPKADLKNILDTKHTEVFAVFEGTFKDAKIFMVQEQETLEPKFKLSIKKINKQEGLDPMKHKTKADIKVKEAKPVITDPEEFKKLQIGKPTTTKAKPVKAEKPAKASKPAKVATGKTCGHTWKDRKGKQQSCTNEAFKKLGEIEMCKKHYNRFHK